MKRNLSLSDGLVLLLLYFKLSGSGPELSWFWVFSPYVLDIFISVVVALATLYSWTDKIKFFIYKILLRIKVKAAGKKARNELRRQYQDARKRTGNPGQFNDEIKTGK